MRREPYWRRTHQLPEVSVCHIHRCMLSEGTTDLSYAHDAYMSLERVLDECHPVSDIHVRASQSLRERLAVAIHDFLNGIVNGKEHIDRSTFAEILAEAGWEHHQVKRNRARTRLIERIIEIYGLDVLSDFGVSHLFYRSSLKSESSQRSTDWLIKCLAAREKMTHPLPYLLIMLALNIPISKLLCAKPPEGINDTSNGPPCYDQGGSCFNPQCRRYVTPDVNRDNSQITSVLLLVKCSDCGYAYRVSTATSKSHFRRIVSYCCVWDQERIDEVKIGASNDLEMRHQFGSCLPNLMRCAIQLRMWHRRWTEPARLRVEAAEERSWKAQRTAKIAKFRFIWFAAVSINPQAGHIEIRKRKPGAHEFLQKCGQDWLDETTPRQTHAPVYRSISIPRNMINPGRLISRRLRTSSPMRCPLNV